MRFSNQETVLQFLQGKTGQGVTAAAAPGLVADSDGWNGAQMIEVVEGNVGTATVNLEGTFDGTNFYAVGYYQVDGNAALTRTVTAISVLQNTKKVYQVLDIYPQLRARISANTGSVVIRAYFVPA